MPKLTETRVREIVREELDAIASQRHTPSLAPVCEKCEAAGNAIVGTVWNGWTLPQRKGKRRVRCRDCYGSWSVVWENKND